MKIVIVSDLHANYDSLSALPEGYDELWALGDLVNYGPQPAEVIEFIRANATACVRGNHDHAVGYNQDPRCTEPYRMMAGETCRFTFSELNNTQKQFLRELPLATDLERDGLKFHLCHAIPSDPLYGYCPPEDEHWAAEVKRTTADVLLVGHTHHAFVRHVGRQVILNPGSLGQPKDGNQRACYAVWAHGKAELKSFSYDVDKVIKKLEALPITAQVFQDLATVLRTGSL